MFVYGSAVTTFCLFVCFLLFFFWRAVLSATLEGSENDSEETDKDTNKDK